MPKIYFSGKTTDLDDCLVYAAFDSSGGADEEHANRQLDKVGCAVVAVDKSMSWFVLELWKKYLNDRQFINVLFEINDKYSPQVLGVEEMPHLRTVMNLEFKIRGRTLPIHTLKPMKRKKHQRIRTLLPLLPSIYFLNTEVADIQARIRSWHIDQEHDDDDWDALAYIIDIVQPPTELLLRNKKKALTAREEDQRFKTLPPADQAEWKRWIKLRDQKPNDVEFIRDMDDFYQTGIESTFQEIF